MAYVKYDATQPWWKQQSQAIVPSGASPAAVSGCCGVGSATPGSMQALQAGVPWWARLGQLAGAATGAYHGYKRNKSVGWAVGWGLLGAIAWPITIPVSVAQGYGKPKRG